MKIITDLTGQATEADFKLNDGVVSQVSEEVTKGFHRSTKLGREGLVLKRGAHSVAIPLAELWKLGISIEPQLVPATPKVEVEPMPAQPV